MKSIVSTFALVLALILTACGKDAETPTTESPAESPAIEQVAPAQEMSDETAAETAVEEAAQADVESAEKSASETTEAVEGADATMEKSPSEEAAGQVAPENSN